MIKKLIQLVALMLVLMQTAVAQQNTNKNCPGSMPEAQFAQAKRTLMAQSSMIQRLRSAISIGKSNCVSTKQLLELMEVFGEDSERLEIALESYHNIFNKSDIYDVYNGFAYMGTAIRFYDFVKEAEKKENSPNTPIIDASEDVRFPLLPYPDVRGYNGASNCLTCLSEGDFKHLIKDVANKQTEEVKVEAARQL